MLPPKPIYYTVHDWMVRDLSLKGGAERDVYALLYSLADRAGVAKVKQSYLIERLGYSEKTVRNAIQALMDKGWLMKARDNNYGVNEYGVVEPASIIGRFTPQLEQPVNITGDLAGTTVNITGEQRQNLPVISVKTTGDTPYYIFDNKIYNNFFYIPDVPSEKKEKEDLLKVFFSAFGVYQPMDEVMRFWAYHEQTGWRNGKGQRIVSKKAAASFWNISDAAHKQTELAKKVIGRLMPVIPEENKICFIAELNEIYQRENNLVMRVNTDQICKILEDNQVIANVLGMTLYKLCGTGSRLLYTINR